MEINLDQIIQGDCLDVLKTFPDNFFDSCVSDVPYGLGTKKPTPEEILSYLQGEVLKTGDFMNKKWNVPSVKVWEQVYRVLKPGGHVLAFAGTRTFDLISMGLRMAGFENRDTIAENHPALQWVYSSGMPKSKNISKQIDLSLGATPKVVGKKMGKGGENLNRLSRPGGGDIEDAKGMGAYGVGAKQTNIEIDVTEPSSDEAQQWSGWGTGLKPSWEPILVFRKPFKGPLFKNVLEHGTGAINIDGTRVKHSSAKDLEEHKKSVEQIKAKGGSRGDSWKNSSDLSGANDVSEGGRWPANFVMVHHPDCKLEGSKKVKGHTGGAIAVRSEGSYKKAGGYYSEGRQQPERKGHTDEDGKEEVANWVCAPGCPIAALDAQSGNRPSTLTGRADPDASHAHPGTEFNPNSTFLGERTHHSKVYADSGGASRFFKQFQAELEGPFIYMPKANRKKAGGCEFKVEHPTLKPYELLQYLVRLVTPKGGTVLDPYCGSGTTCHAALLEDCHYIGIELGQEGEYDEAVKRLEVIKRQIRESKEQLGLDEIFDQGFEDE